MDDDLLVALASKHLPDLQNADMMSYMRCVMFLLLSFSANLPLVLILEKQDMENNKLNTEKNEEK